MFDKIDNRTQRLPKSSIESMELIRLPSPPHILCKLLDICHDPDSSLTDLTEIINTDIALTSKLIMAVNSAAFAQNEPSENLQQAVKFLGHDRVKTMAVTASIQQFFSGLTHSRNESLCNTWLDSLYCAMFAREIAISLNYAHPRDAYLAGLLHDLGKIVLDVKFHEQYVGIINAESEDEAIQQEISEFGFSHTELGAGIIDQWPSLSPAIADAARFHHEEKEQLKGCDVLCQVVAEASQMAWHWSRCGGVDTNWHSLLVADIELDKILAQVEHKMALTAARLDITLVDSKSLTRDQLCSGLEIENMRLARRVRDASLINVINAGESDSGGVDTPRSLLLKVAREMKLLFAISDVALLFPDAGDADFLALYEVKHAHSVSKFPVANGNSQIIRSFLEKRNIWIEPVNMHEQISPISDRQIIRRLNHKIALCLPLKSADQVIGTIIIGTSYRHKSYLDKLSKIISSYLESIVDNWLKSNQGLKQQALEDSSKKQQEEKDIDKLIHEISNPLSVIGNYIDIINFDSASDGRENEKEIAILKEELQRIGNIVLNFKNSQGSEAQTVFLNDELKTCIPLYVKSIGNDKDVQINWHLDEADCELDMTRDAFRQIVLNLVKNAVEAQPGNAEINVSSHHFVNIAGVVFAQFSIADRGKGVDAITRRRLFSPLSSTKEGSRRGLGLSVVTEILNSFNGQIKYMENETGGASFEVLIPLSLTK